MIPEEDELAEQPNLEEQALGEDQDHLDQEMEEEEQEQEEEEVI
jgi:hypothetical protein